MYPLECICFAKREMNITANNWASNVKKLLDRVVPKCPTFDRAEFHDVLDVPKLRKSSQIFTFTTVENYVERCVHSRMARRSTIVSVINVIQRNQKHLLNFGLSTPYKNTRKYRHILFKIHLSSHQLAIEKGHHINIKRHQRKCPKCTSDIEEDFEEELNKLHASVRILILLFQFVFTMHSLI